MKLDAWKRGVVSFRDFVDSFEQFGVKSLHELADRYERKVAALEAQLRQERERASPCKCKCSNPACDCQWRHTCDCEPKIAR